MKGRRAALIVVLTAPGLVSAQQGAPDYLIEGAALLRAASHMASRCPDVQVDVDTDLNLRVAVYGMLERDGWTIDDPRLHSDSMRAAVLDATAARYAGLGLSQPLVAEQVCPVAREQAREGTALGRLFRVDAP